MCIFYFSLLNQSVLYYYKELFREYIERGFKN